MRDHPDIESALLTGYPRSNQPESSLICDQCGEPIPVDAHYYSIFGHNICYDCIEDFAEVNWGDD